jgi:hypothetical protein
VPVAATWPSSRGGPTITSARAGSSLVTTKPCGRSRGTKTKLPAVAGLVAGLPWMLLSLPGLLHLIELRDYGLLSGLTTAVAALVSWPAYGFFFGACYPLIRGRTGLGKGLTMFVTLSIPAALVLLGLGADLLALRRAGEGPGQLVEVHNMRALVARGSGVTAAVAATVATALATGVTALVIGVLGPQVPETPPVPRPRPAATPSPVG